MINLPYFILLLILKSLNTKVEAKVKRFFPEQFMPFFKSKGFIERSDFNGLQNLMIVKGDSLI